MKRKIVQISSSVITDILILIFIMVERSQTTYYLLYFQLSLDLHTFASIYFGSVSDWEDNSKFTWLNGTHSYFSKIIMNIVYGIFFILFKDKERKDTSCRFIYSYVLYVVLESIFFVIYQKLNQRY